MDPSIRASIEPACGNKQIMFCIKNSLTGMRGRPGPYNGDTIGMNANVERDQENKYGV